MLRTRCADATVRVLSTYVQEIGSGGGGGGGTEHVLVFRQSGRLAPKSELGCVGGKGLETTDDRNVSWTCARSDKGCLAPFHT